MDQVARFNFLEFIGVVFFNTILSKNNMTKLLDKESTRLHSEIEEIKDTIRDRS